MAQQDDCQKSARTDAGKSRAAPFLGGSAAGFLCAHRIKAWPAIVAVVAAAGRRSSLRDVGQATVLPARVSGLCRL